MNKKGLTLITPAMVVVLLMTTLLTSCGKIKEESVHAGLFVAEQRAEVDHPKVSATNHGITATLTTAVAGYDSILLSIDFTGCDNASALQSMIEIGMMNVSLLIEMGFTALAIADRVGHESIDITYRYAHLFSSKQAEMAAKLNLERVTTP